MTREKILVNCDIYSLVLSGVLWYYFIMSGELRLSYSKGAIQILCHVTTQLRMPITLALKSLN